MSMKAKPIINNRFWVIEDEGVRIGTLSKDADGFVFSKKGEIKFYENETQIKKKFGKNFLTAYVKTNNQDKFINGYPTRCVPHNTMFDVQRNLPLFTKSESSKSLYCAGYYLIKFNKNWLKSFCPKLITIEQNDYCGPFKTEKEMKDELTRVNRST